MFAKTIIDSDAFLDMPLSAQALYFHLSMRADDEGFINNPKKIQRMIGAADDDMKVLLAKNFVIQFESGVIVIKHWKIHNYIRADRLNKTAYEDERSMLEVKNNGAYTLSLNECQSNDSQMSDICQSNDRIGKDRLGKNRLGKDSKDKVSYFPNDENLDKAFSDYVAMRKKLKKPMTDRAVELAIKKLNDLSNGDNDIAIKIIEQSIMNSWQGLFPLKEETKTQGIDWSKV